MPGRDRTGPRGLGPMTGRRAGFCAGNAQPYIGGGYGFNRFGGRGGFAGRGGFGGGGRGWRNRYFATGQAGWMSSNIPVQPEDELNALKQSAEMLKAELESIQRRISELDAS